MTRRTEPSGCGTGTRDETRRRFQWAECQMGGRGGAAEKKKRCLSNWLFRGPCKESMGQPMPMWCGGYNKYVLRCGAFFFLLFYFGRSVFMCTSSACMQLESSVWCRGSGAGCGAESWCFTPVNLRSGLESKKKTAASNTHRPSTGTQLPVKVEVQEWCSISPSRQVTSGRSALASVPHTLYTIKYLYTTNLNNLGRSLPRDKTSAPNLEYLS